MTDVDRRRKGIPPLVWIVVALLALLVVIAAVGRDGKVTSPDSRVTMPVDLPGETTVDPAPTPPPVTPKPQ